MNSKSTNRKTRKSSKPSVKPSGKSSPSGAGAIIRPAALAGATLPRMQRSAQFPPAWLWLVDEALPTLVKKNYSPKESWKDKPFTKEDAGFFFKGIEELSELFTEERSKG